MILEAAPEQSSWHRFSRTMDVGVVNPCECAVEFSLTEKNVLNIISTVKSMFFGFYLYLISLVSMSVCFFRPAITLKGGFDHASIHLDRGLVSLGFSRHRQDGR